MKTKIENRTNRSIMQLETQNKSIIDERGYGDLVRQYRAKGLSYLTIAKELNKLPENVGQPIPPQVIGAWGRLNIEEKMSTTRRNEIINTYNENKRLLAAVENQMTLIEVFLDDLSQEVLSTSDVATLYKRMQDLNKDYEKYINRKQSIL